MNYETIIVERKGHIGVLTLNRPEVRNALNVPMMHEIISGLSEFEKDSQVRVVVMKGAGPQAFCAGRDLGDLRDRTVMEYRQLFRGVGDIMELIADMNKPVIAAVHGFALAGGCGLAASCDMVVAADDAVFGCPESGIGLFPMMIMAALKRSVGSRPKCMEFLMTGDRMDAREAERIGLVNRVVAREKLEEETMSLAEKIASKSPAAIQLGKRAFYTMADMEYKEAIRYLEEMIAITAATGDAKEGIESFFEKRKPQWKGQ